MPRITPGTGSMALSTAKIAKNPWELAFTYYDEVAAYQRAAALKGVGHTVRVKVVRSRKSKLRRFNIWIVPN